jgi:hypothetical protein
LGIPLGFTESSARDINNDGLIVGQASGTIGTAAFLNVGNEWIDLNTRLLNGANWQLESAVAINGSGVIVGVGHFAGQPRAFRLDPVRLAPGDYNRDGSVDAADYIVWRRARGQTDAGIDADGNGNGRIDDGDYQVWRSNFGKLATFDGGANAAVPESALLPAFLPAILALFNWRRLVARIRY